VADVAPAGAWPAADPGDRFGVDQVADAGVWDDSLVIEHNSVRILATTATSVHDSDTLGLGARLPTSMLIKNTPTFSIDRMSEMMTSSLRLCFDENVREVYVHPLTIWLEWRCPFCFIPLSCGNTQ